MLKKNLATLALAAVLSIGALPALADSASFSFTVGDHSGYSRNYHNGHHKSWGHGRGYGRGHGYRDYGYHDYGHRSYYRESFHHWGPPAYFAPRPVVFYQEPTVIERRVIIQEPEVINATRGRLVSNSPYCREYQRNVTVGNRNEQSYGTACRQPDGAWKVVSEND
mgnify:CR=1 FL=1